MSQGEVGYFRFALSSSRNTYSVELGMRTRCFQGKGYVYNASNSGCRKTSAADNPRDRGMAGKEA